MAIEHIQEVMGKNVGQSNNNGVCPLCGDSHKIKGADSTGETGEESHHERAAVRNLSPRSGGEGSDPIPTPTLGSQISGMSWKFLLFLVALTMGYLALGGLIFERLESPDEERRLAARLTPKQFAASLAGRYDYLNETQLAELVALVLQASDNGEVSNKEEIRDWTYGQAVFFSGTIVTTIGYGNSSPSTFAGQAVTILYAFLGIPLTAVMLVGLGNKLHVMFKRIDHLLAATSNWCKRSRKVSKTLRTLLLFASAMAIFLLIPSIIFMYTEGWSYNEGVYYAFVTLSTIGFGDYVAGNSHTYKGRNPTIYRAILTVWLFIGLAWIVFLFNTIEELMQELVKRGEKGVHHSLHHLQDSFHHRTHTQGQHHHNASKLPHTMESQSVTDGKDNNAFHASVDLKKDLAPVDTPPANVSSLYNMTKETT